MPRTNDGEFELVLYNRQLLGVFFVVVVLLGIFFAMGYIVGRNSAGSARVATAGEPLIVESGRPASPPAAAPKPQPVADLEEVRPPAAESERKAPEPKPAEAPPAKSVTAQTAPAKPSPAPAQPPAATAPQPGQLYLQVAATTRVEAEALRDQLARKGFPAVIGPVPGQDLFRVLVGPVGDAAALAKTRSALQEIGLKPFTRRY
jgi:cell division septation protein DedD